MLSKRHGLMRMLVEQAKAQGKHNKQGAFKQCWRVEWGRRVYALKAGRPPAEQYHQHVTKMGTGEEDLLREIVSQATGFVHRQCIVPYVAWAWIDGRFYAAQPWCEGGELSWADVSIYDEAWEGMGAQDTHPDNLRIYRGEVRAIDFGWVKNDNGEPLRLEEGTAERVRFSYRKAA